MLIACTLTILVMMTYLVDNIEYCRQVDEESEMRLQESQTSADVMLVTMLTMLTMMTYLVDNIE